MTTATDRPTPELLGDEQVTRMQTRVDNNEPLRLYLAEFGIDVPALCATVRVLREQLYEEQRRNQIQAETIMEYEAGLPRSLRSV